MNEQELREAAREIVAQNPEQATRLDMWLRERGAELSDEDFAELLQRLAMMLLRNAAARREEFVPDERIAAITKEEFKRRMDPSEASRSVGADELEDAIIQRVIQEIREWEGG